MTEVSDRILEEPNKRMQVEGFLAKFNPGRSSTQDTEPDPGLLQSVMKSLQGIFMVFDRDRELVVWNKQIDDLAGLEADQSLLSKSFSQLVDIPDQNLVRTVLRDQTTQKTEAKLLFGTGDPVTVTATVSPVVTVGGDSAGFILVAAELEDQLEWKLQNSRDFLKRIFNTIPDVLYLLDDEGSMLEWNDRLNQITGYSDDRIRRMDPGDFVPESDESKITDAIQKVIRENDVVSVESKLVTKSGERIPYEFNGSPLVDRSGELVGLVGTGRNISERKRNEKELASKKQELERINNELETRVQRRTQELEEFLSAVSHDLREPLRQIDHYTDFLKEDLDQLEELSDGLREDLDFLTDAAERMQNQIDGLLRLSRIGQRELQVEHVDPEESIRSALQNLEHELEADDARIEIEDLPDVEADPDLLTDLYQNLTSNALKYSGDSTPRISYTGDKTNDSVILGVKDNGTGINAELQESVFEPFKQLQGWNDQDGIGLGLSVCRRIVARHNGEIWVDSDVGKGSHFQFELPKGG